MPTNQTQQKRIVIIEGDAFDADAIVAIVRVGMGTHSIAVHTEHKTLECYHADEAARDAALSVAVLAWRGAVGDVPVVDTIPPTPSDPLPDQSPPEPTYWSDEKGRFYEIYDGQPIHLSPITGERLIWNAGPPGRSNVVGPRASPILKVYVDDFNRPLTTQPAITTGP